MAGREAFFDVARSKVVCYLFADPGTTERPLLDELVSETGVELILALQEATVRPLDG